MCEGLIWMDYHENGMTDDVNSMVCSLNEWSLYEDSERNYAWLNYMDDSIIRTVHGWMDGWVDDYLNPCWYLHYKLYSALHLLTTTTTHRYSQARKQAIKSGGNPLEWPEKAPVKADSIERVFMAMDDDCEHITVVPDSKQFDYIKGNMERSWRVHMFKPPEDQQ